MKRKSHLATSRKNQETAHSTDNTEGVTKHNEELLDEALQETFPASDPIAPAHRD
ncbi:hypothetical protein FHS85_004904 [Rhodoligotrophos appendicifer]